jgi:hypothetical protein
MDNPVCSVCGKPAVILNQNLVETKPVQGASKRREKTVSVFWRTYRPAGNPIAYCKEHERSVEVSHIHADGLGDLGWMDCYVAAVTGTKPVRRRMIGEQEEG